MEIQVGEYVRNKYGAIRKFKGYLNEEMYISSLNYEDAIVNYKTDKLLLDSSFGGASIGRFKDIIKHSFNIIDLIEEGDYVNGKEVSQVLKDKKGNITDVCYYEEAEEQMYSLGDIKSIVTKEQFKSMEYVIREE